MSGPRVSAVISNLNGERFLPRLLDSLEAQQGVDVEIIVVDRHSKDGSKAVLAKHPNVVVLDEPPETGLVTGYTRGVARARHDLLFFANEDMHFDVDCLRLLSQAVKPAQGIAAADPWQWSYEGERWIHGGTRFAPARLDLNSAWPFARYEFTVDLPAGAEIPFANAGAFLIDRGVFEQVGGWDTSFFLDAEDTDLGIRLWQRGWRSVQVPQAKVFHAVGASNTQTIGAAGTTPVSRRRYVSAKANLAVIAVKYYSAPSTLVPVGTWLARTAGAVVRRRTDTLKLEAQVAVEVARRLPGALRWRHEHRDDNRRNPGERFFAQPGFRI